MDNAQQQGKKYGESLFLFLSLYLCTQSLEYTQGVHWLKNDIILKCLLSLLFMVTNHLDLVTAIRFIQKKYFHYQMKVRGHDKGHQRSKSQIGIGSWISSEFDYRHIVELKSKFWCTIGHHLVLFQFWPNLLHKIVILATLHLIFSQKMDV